MASISIMSSMSGNHILNKTCWKLFGVSTLIRELNSALICRMRRFRYPLPLRVILAWNYLKKIKPARTSECRVVKGLGVKIDDLIDRLESNAFAEVQGRHAELPESEQKHIAHTLAVGALRYFLMKYTRTSVIAFDFKEALAFEGETGVYVQNAAVRIGSIFRKLTEANIPAENALTNVSDERLTELLIGVDGDDWWSLIYLASRLREITEQAVATLEPAVVTRYAFQMAQRFNVFYQKYRILSETDEARRALLITIAAFVRQQLIAALGLLGIEVPEKM